jgi:hypothetical protein
MTDSQAELTIRRASGYADRLRAYTIRVDGADCGKIGANQSVTVAVAPGSHTLAVALDWCSCKPVRVDAAPGMRAEFECGNNLVGWRLALALFYVLFRRDEYLYLRPSRAA